MKCPAGRHSTKCISALVKLKAASVRNMENKDESEEEHQQHAPESDEERLQHAPESDEERPQHAPESDEEHRESATKETGRPSTVQRTSANESRSPEPGLLLPKPNYGEARHVSQEISQEGSPDPEEGVASTSKRRDSRLRAQIASVSDIQNDSDGSSSTRGASGSWKSSRKASSRKPSARTNASHAESIEGEMELRDRETTGPTMGQYKYKNTKEDYQVLSQNLQEKTIKTLLHLGEIYKAAYVDSQPQPMRPAVAPRLSQPTTEAHLYALDKELKSVARRINETKREQAFTMNRINELELKIFQDQGAEYVREIMTKVPNEGDLKNIEQIRQLMLERKRLDKAIKKLNMEISAMNKAMANADVIISDCSAIKKPRRVVICTRPSSPAQDESTSHIGKGSEASPPPTETDDSLIPESPVGIVDPGSSGRSDTSPEPGADRENDDGNPEERQSNSRK